DLFSSISRGIRDSIRHGYEIRDDHRRRMELETVRKAVRCLRMIFVVAPPMIIRDLECYPPGGDDPERHDRAWRTIAIRLGRLAEKLDEAARILNEALETGLRTDTLCALYEMISLKRTLAMQLLALPAPVGAEEVAKLHEIGQLWRAFGKSRRILIDDLRCVAGEEPISRDGARSQAGYLP